LITQAMKLDLQNKLSRFGTNIIISPKKDELPLTYGSVTLPGLKIKSKNFIDESHIERLKTLKDIGVLSPKVIGRVIINTGIPHSTVLVGVSFRNETALKSWWTVNGKTPSSAKEALVGSSVASKLKLKAGSSTYISGSLYKISAVLKETGASDDNAVFVSLSEAQKILGLKNKISLVETRTANSNFSAKKLAEKISAKFSSIEASALEEALRAQKENVEFFSWFSLISSAIILLFSALIVFITLMASINERVREIGIFRAIGFRKKHIIKIILVEAIIISFTGGLMGALLGYIFARTSLPFFVKGLRYVPFSPWILLSAVLLAIFLSCIASFLPARKASKLDPAEALRFI